MTEEGIIEVRLPEGPVCGTDGGQGVTCILPEANLASWHEVYGGHLGRAEVEGRDGEVYVTWQEGAADPDDPEAALPMLYARPDIVDPAREEV